ncbi:LuxR C-terminal-related transcriptional regulator [Streptomyces olivoreticuli]|uniref:response regulator transcription factor n=1 Tax=Streptomyces olivoreticuli TaxID=68246 RepID=UPI00265B1380|nr:LuxR C-terminal-related transcriptional regulator [Streptomyces olivoreticuli]WKK22085.1 LuxR C-terminal-related transcriptional regulator [Streptomyces olivoreticuli]
MACIVAECPHAASADDAAHAACVPSGPAEMSPWRPESERVALLSGREVEVFELLGEGFSNRSIAQRLDVTERTVKFHVARVLSKLRVESRLQAGLVAHTYRFLYQGTVPRMIGTR